MSLCCYEKLPRSHSDKELRKTFYRQFLTASSMSSANNNIPMRTSSLFPWSTYPLTPNVYGHNPTAIFPFTYPIYPFGNMGWSNVVKKDYLLEMPSFNSLPLPTKSDGEFKNNRFSSVQSNESGQCPMCEFCTSSRNELSEHFFHELRKIEDSFQNFKSKSLSKNSSVSNDDQNCHYSYENRRNVLNNIKSRRLQRVHAKRLSSSPYHNVKCDQMSDNYSMKSETQSPISDIEKEMIETKVNEKQCNSCKKMCGNSFVSLTCRHILCFICYSDCNLGLNKICTVCECQTDNSRFEEISS